MSSASTKDVNTKGNNKVSQGQWVATAKMVRATKKKNTNQYNPFDLFFISMLKSFGKNRVAQQNKKQQILKPFSYSPHIQSFSYFRRSAITAQQHNPQQYL